MNNEYHELEKLRQEIKEGNSHLYGIDFKLKLLNNWTDNISYILIISFVVWLVSPIFSDFNQVRHWNFIADMNGDGRESIRDLWRYFHWAFFYPGDWIIQYLANTSFGKYWELSSSDYGGLLSALLSFVVIFTPVAGVAAFLTRKTPLGESSVVNNISFGILIASMFLVAFFVYLMIFVFVALMVFS